MRDIADRLSRALAERYRLDCGLGAGGMATVYLTHDLKHGRDVAIKMLHPDLGAALGGDRFLTDVRTTARLQHLHIVPLLDSGEADDRLRDVRFRRLSWPRVGAGSGRTLPHQVAPQCDATV